MFSHSLFFLRATFLLMGGFFMPLKNAATVFLRYFCTRFYTVLYQKSLVMRLKG
jgi:hypothetical protein